MELSLMLCVYSRAHTRPAFWRGETKAATSNVILTYFNRFDDFNDYTVQRSSDCDRTAVKYFQKITYTPRNNQFGGFICCKRVTRILRCNSEWVADDILVIRRLMKYQRDFTTIALPVII